MSSSKFRDTNSESKKASSAEDRFASQSENRDDTFLSNTVKTFIGQCAGFVDVASFVIQSCRGDGDSQQNRESHILGPMFEPRRGLRKVRRRQGGTLEFPADGCFEDDVSALSANTLDEMERLAPQLSTRSLSGRGRYDGRNQPYPGQHLVPPLETVEETTRSSRTTGSTEDCEINMQRASSEADMSLSVATSGSASTPDDRTMRNRTQSTWQRPEEMQVFKARVEV